MGRVCVSRPTVFGWNQRLEQGGLEALRSGTPGRPARLHVDILGQQLLAEARAQGYATELWALPRIWYRARCSALTSWV